MEEVIEGILKKLNNGESEITYRYSLKFDSERELNNFLSGYGR